MNIYDNSYDDVALSAEDFDCSDIHLSKRQKMWIVQQVLSGRISAAAIAIKYNMKRKLINQYVCRAKKGKTLCENSGRPRALDKLSMERTEVWISDSEDTNLEKLKGVLRDEYRGTCSRKYSARFQSDLEIDPVCNMSRRTLNRYLIKLCVKNNKTIPQNELDSDII
jgi:transposase